MAGKTRSRRGLGKQGSKLLTILSASKKTVFALKDAERALGGIGGPRLRKLLHDLAKGRWVERIERGKYLIYPLEAGWKPDYGTHPFIIARGLVEPYYVGFWSALNYYGITEQGSRTTLIATTKKKRPFPYKEEVYRFVSLPRKRFFGIRKEWMGESTFNISDREKTVLDCLFLPKYGGGLTEVAKAFREKIDYGKLCAYAVKMDDLATLKRLGCLLDVLEIKTANAGKLLGRVSGGYCLLDAAGPKTGEKNAKWRVIENIPREELRRERGEHDKL